MSGYCEDCLWFGARRAGQPCATVACLHSGALNTPPDICRDQPERPWRDDCEHSRRSYGHCRDGRHYSPAVAAPVARLSRWQRFDRAVGPRLGTALAHGFCGMLACLLVGAFCVSDPVTPAWVWVVIGTSAGWGALRPFAFMTEPQP